MRRRTQKTRLKEKQRTKWKALTNKQDFGFDLEWKEDLRQGPEQVTGSDLPCGFHSRYCARNSPGRHGGGWRPVE
jgi:hypothetical protein